MHTFKQFLIENEPSPLNVDGQFTVGKVEFDNEKGLGSTPNNGNVAYMGAVAWMKPAKFRQLALQSDRSEDAKKLEDLMKNGRATGCPFLYLSIKYKNDKEDEEILSISVDGHEGRARSDAISKINGPDKLMPVHLFFRGGMRSRHLVQKIWDHIGSHGLYPEGIKSRSIDSGIDHVFVNGKTIKL